MTSTTTMTMLLRSLGVQFPLIVVCFLGLILALTQINRVPRVAALVVAGLGLYLVAGMLQTFTQPLLQSMLMQNANRGNGPMNFQLISGVVGFSYNIVRGIALALVAYAAFVDRPPLAFMIPPLGTGPRLPSGRPVDGPKVPGNVA
jgi:hypothetical protein